MIRILAVSSVALALLALACSSSSNTGTGGTPANAVTCSGSPTPVGELESESSSAGCSQAFLLKGDAGAGAPCQGGEDCQPTCCACPAGKKYSETLAAGCVNGHCIDAQTTCCGVLGDIQNESAGSIGPCD